MSGVKRYKLRKGGKWKLLLALVLLLLITGAIVFFVSRQEDALPEIKKDPPKVLLDREDIVRVLIENPYDDPYALNCAGENWYIEGESGIAYRQTMLEDIFNNAAYLEAEETVIDLNAVTDVTAADFGLADNAVRVTVTYADGATAAFAIGDAVHGAPIAFYYCQMAGDSTVYTVTVDVWDVFTNSRMALREVADPALNGSLIDRIAFTGDHPLTLEKRYDGWYMTEPFVYPLDDAAVEAVLEDIEGVRFAQLVGMADELDLAAYGLDSPRRTMTLDIAESVVTGYDENGQVMGEKALPAYQLTFDMGSDENDVVFYCNYRGEVVKVTRFSADFMLTQGYESLLSTAPANAPTNDLVRMTWQSGSETRDYTFALTEQIAENNDFITDENGNILYDLHVYAGENEVDDAEFLVAYRQLLLLRTTRRLSESYQLSGTPHLTVTLTRSGSTRELAFYPYDALHDAVAVDGIALFYVEKSWMNSIVWP